MPPAKGVPMNRPWAFSALLLSTNLVAQVPPGQETPGAALRLSLDAQSASVDGDFLHTELAWVDWVRDPKDAQVDLILTAKPSGGGGTVYFLRFIGLDPFQGVDDTLEYAAASGETPDMTRHGLARQIAFGLARYVARTPSAAARLSVQPTAGAAPASPTQGRDPWNAWVYQLGLNGNFNGEAQDSSSYTSANAGASRVTTKDIFRFNTNGSWNRARYEIGPGETLYTRTSAFNANLVDAQGLSPHWTWGLLGSYTQSSVMNLQASSRLAPALEYSLWDYADSNQRELTFLYQIGAGHNRYIEETILGKTSETVYDNALSITLSLNQPWGTVRTSLNGTAYLNNWSEYSVGVSSSLMLHLGRGFSLNLFGSYTKQQNQIALPMAAATPDQVLLHLTQLPSSYNYFGFVGLSYTFGSIFNNAVNARFPGVGGGSGSTVIISN